MLDTAFVRSFFPALETDWALFDNAGGSAPVRQVIEGAAEHLRRFPVQLEASYPLSAAAGERVEAGERAAEALVGAGEGEVVLGASTSMNVYLLARALRAGWAAGDEVIVTNLDHETNVGAWRRLEETGIRIREWRFDPETVTLRLADLEPLLTRRTRLVCFTHCSNVVGAIHDVAAVTRRVHEAGALVCVDGVAYAPHRRVDVKAWDVDFYLVSLYKTYGPHLGLLYGKRELLRAARSQNHDFLGEDEVPYKLEPGGVNYELVSALPGILDYLDAVDREHFGRETASRSERLERTFELFAAHEERLAAPLFALLASKPGVRVLGPATADRSLRVPTVAFTVEGRDSAEIPPLVDRQRVAIRFGHFYAYRPIRDLGLLETNGVVRASMVHYNTPEEVTRLIEALDAAL